MAGVAGGLCLVVLAVAALALASHPTVTVAIPRSAAKAAAPKVTPTFPSAWDPRVVPLVDFVQKERGLTYQHPVNVHFLTAAQYTAAVQASPGDAPGQAAKGVPSDAQQQAMYRAVGLISGNVDLNSSSLRLADNGTLAYYSDVTKEINVRGTDLTVGLRVTLAHELTHALQDQYFDLGRTDNLDTSGQQFAFTALVEGDAVRVETAYVASLSPAEQQAYDNEQNSQQGTASSGLAGVPPALITLFGAPYDLGPELVRVLLAHNGNAAVDDAMRNPPSDELQVFDPWVFLAQTPAQHVADPALLGGEKSFDTGDFGAMSWYIVLTQRIDPHLALPAADAWGGDAYVAYTKNNQTCVRADIVASTPAGVAPLAGAFTAWAKTMPGGSATVTTNAGGIDVVACDPGTGANLQPVATAKDALVLPAARAEFTLGAIKGGGSVTVARCSGTAVAESYSETDLLDPSVLFGTAAGRAKVARVIAPCRP